MTAPAEQIVTVRMPQINVNDEEVMLVGWLIDDGQPVAQGQPLAEVETSKSVDEVPAPAGGVVRHIARPGQRLRVGAVFAYIGPSAEAIETHLAGPRVSAPQADSSVPRVTAGAVILARRYGLDPTKVPAHGATVRRKDIEQLARDSELPAVYGHRPAEGAGGVPAGSEESVPPALLGKVGEPEELSNHQWVVAQHLSRTRARLVPAHVAMDAGMDRVLAWAETRRKAGTMTGPLPLLLWATAAACQAHPKLTTFRLGRRVYPHRSIDIAFAARGRDGRLFTPVVRAADRLSPDELIEECARLTMGLYRGQLRAEEVSGGCITVSLIDQQPVLYHVGMQNAYQSAILTVGAVREQVIWSEGRATPRPTATLVLSYDHGLLDGWEASTSLDHIRNTLITLQVE